MKKKEFLALITEKLKDFSDDDEVMIEVNGGEYWGAYEAELKIEVQDYPDGGALLGHPKNLKRCDAKKVAVIKDV